MYKPSLMPTTDSSYCGSKPITDHTISDLKPQQFTLNQPKTQSMDTNPIKIDQHQQSQQHQQHQQQQQKKLRRPSFTQLEAQKQIKIEKMIRTEIQKFSKLSGRMALEQDQTCICTSDIYAREGEHWRNREITQLTNKRFNDVPIGKIKKIKLLNQQPMAGYNLFRITLNQKQVKDYAIRAVDVPLWFSNTVWVCLANMGLQVNIKRQFQSQISGMILKKSQFLGNWQPRWVTLSTKTGLLSFRNSSKQSLVTMKIQKSSQVWTRLETITHENGRYLVLKTWHLMFKYQFGIPLGDVIGWLKAFCVLIK